MTIIFIRVVLLTHIDQTSIYVTLPYLTYGVGWRPGLRLVYKRILGDWSANLWKKDFSILRGFREFNIVPDQIFPELNQQSVPTIPVEQLLARFRDGGQTEEASYDTSHLWVETSVVSPPSTRQAVRQTTY